MTAEHLNLIAQDFQDTVPGMFRSPSQFAPLQRIRIGHSVAANDPRTILFTEDELLQAPCDIAATLAVPPTGRPAISTRPMPGHASGVQSWTRRHALWVLVASCLLSVGLLAAVSARLTQV